MQPLAPATRATLDQMGAACRDWWDQTDVDLGDPAQLRAVRATLSAVLWAYHHGHLGMWLTALCETADRE